MGQTVDPSFYHATNRKEGTLLVRLIFSHSSLRSTLNIMGMLCNVSKMAKHVLMECKGNNLVFRVLFKCLQDTGLYGRV